MLEGLADSIDRHGKIILAVWIVAVLVLIPPAVKAFDSMGYGIHDITGEDSESSVADRMITQYFDGPEVDVSRMPLLVIDYRDRDGYRQLQGDEDVSLKPYTDYLRSGFLRDSDWAEKLDLGDGGLKVIDTYGDENAGAILMGILYESSYSDSDIVAETQVLRAKVAELTDRYMYDLYEPDRHFDTYLTGACAITYDMGSDSKSALMITIGLVFLMTLVLSGLFFGSAMSSAISFISVSFVSIVSMATVFGISRMTGVFFIPGLLVLFAVIMMGFVHCMYIIAVYRDELLSGNSRDEALRNTVLRTGRAVFSSVVCITVSSLVLALMTDGPFQRFGMCMAVASMVLMMASLTVPASLIHVTRNELFWTATPDEKVRFGSVQRIYNRLSRFFASSARVISHMSRGKAVAILTVVIFASVGSAVLVDENGPVERTPYDLADSITTGESKAGLEVLEDYGKGGMFYPYSVVVGFNDPIGVISTGDKGFGTIAWIDDSVFGMMSSVSDAIRIAGGDNISTVHSLVDWTSILSEASEGVTDPDLILDNAAAILDEREPMAVQPYQKILSGLRLAGCSSQDIVDTRGPEIDYAMNSALGLVGYEMNSARDVVVTHLMVSYVTCESSLSKESLETTESVSDALAPIAGQYDRMEGIWMTGAGMVYYEVIGSVENGFNVVSAILLIILVFTLLIVTFSFTSSFRAIVTTVMNIVISMFIVEYATSAIWGSVSMTVQVAMIVMAISIGIWFDMIQDSHVRRLTDKHIDRRSATRDMLLRVQPVIVVTASILTVCFLALMSSSIQMISQLGFSLAICIAVDAFVIRTLVSPTLFSGSWRKNRD